jgi:Fic family protein
MNTPAHYLPFPSFASWLEQSPNIAGDEILVGISKELSSKPEAMRKRALELVRNVTAVETGAIEDLYPSDRGLTITAATEVAILEAVGQKHGEKVRSYVEAALDAYEHVLDFATKQRDLAPTWLRELHSLICRNQDTHRVRVAEVFEDRPLIKGAYKTLPNHVLRTNGQVHYYAPPEETEIEVRRMIEELNSSEFQKAHPIEQASFAHYAFVKIHPFADGNGRVARALAAIFTYRAYSLPLLIYASQRSEYFDALEKADVDSYEPFKTFVFRAAMRAGRLLRQSFSAAEQPAPSEAFRSAANMYATSGGYLQTEVDQCAVNLVELLQAAVQKRILEIRSDTQVPESRRNTITIESHISGGNWTTSRPDHRRPIEALQGRAVHIIVKSIAPADGHASLIAGVSLPRDAMLADSFVFDTSPATETVEIPLADVMNGDTLEAETLLEIYSGMLVGRAFAMIEHLGRDSLRKKGFGTP